MFGLLPAGAAAAAVVPAAAGVVAAPAAGVVAAPAAGVVRRGRLGRRAGGRGRGRRARRPGSCAAPAAGVVAAAGLVAAPAAGAAVAAPAAGAVVAAAAGAVVAAAAGFAAVVGAAVGAAGAPQAEDRQRQDRQHGYQPESDAGSSSRGLLHYRLAAVQGGPTGHATLSDICVSPLGCQERALAPGVQNPTAGRTVGNLPLSRLLHFRSRQRGATAQTHVPIDPCDGNATPDAPQLVITAQDRAGDAAAAACRRGVSALSSAVRRLPSARRLVWSPFQRSSIRARSRAWAVADARRSSTCPITLRSPVLDPPERDLEVLDLGLQAAQLLRVLDRPGIELRLELLDLAAAVLDLPSSCRCRASSACSLTRVSSASLRAALTPSVGPSAARITSMRALFWSISVSTPAAELAFRAQPLPGHLTRSLLEAGGDVPLVVEEAPLVALLDVSRCGPRAVTSTSATTSTPPICGIGRRLIARTTVLLAPRDRGVERRPRLRRGVRRPVLQRAAHVAVRDDLEVLGHRGLRGFVRQLRRRRLVCGCPGATGFDGGVGASSIGRRGGSGVGKGVALGSGVGSGVALASGVAVSTQRRRPSSWIMTAIEPDANPPSRPPWRPTTAPPYVDPTADGGRPDQEDQDRDRGRGKRRADDEAERLAEDEPLPRRRLVVLLELLVLVLLRLRRRRASSRRRGRRAPAEGGRRRAMA